MNNLLDISDKPAMYYYESHITIEPVFGERLEFVKELCGQFNFKVADLLMKKREDDTEKRSKNDTFTTGHSKSLKDIMSRTYQLVELLIANGYQVWRYKIEDTVLDSRIEEVFELFYKGE